MKERDYPIYAALSPGYRTAETDDIAPNPVLSADEWAKRLAKIDQAQAADVQHAIEEAKELHSDVHLYIRRGSQFLGIGFEHNNGSYVRIFDYPEI